MPGISHGPFGDARTRETTETKGARDEARVSASDAAAALVAALLDRAHATGRFPTVQELAFDDALDTFGLDELETLGAVLCVPPPIGPYDERARMTIVLTRNAVRLLPPERAAQEIDAVLTVRAAFEARYRVAGQPRWLTLEMLAIMVRLTKEATAVALVLLLADQRSPNVRQLSPYGGCPHEILVDFELAAADPSPSTSQLEPLTWAQSYASRAAQVPTAASPDDVGPGYTVASETVHAVAPEPGRRGRGKGGRLSTAELLAPHAEVFRRRWELGEFAAAIDARKELQALVNREGDRALVEGDDGFKDIEDIRLRTSTWFPRDRRGCRAARPTTADNDDESR
jgi:hypothetical protein